MHTSLTVMTRPSVPTRSPRHPGKSHTGSSIRAASWTVCSRGVSVKVYFDLVSFQFFRYLIWKQEARGKSLDAKKTKRKQMLASINDLSDYVCIPGDDCMLSASRRRSFGGDIYRTGQF